MLFDTTFARNFPTFLSSKKVFVRKFLRRKFFARKFSKFCVFEEGFARIFVFRKQMEENYVDEPREGRILGDLSVDGGHFRAYF